MLFHGNNSYTQQNDRFIRKKELQCFMLNKRGVFDIVRAFDIVGFVFLLIGGGLARFGNNEIVSILGTFVMAGGATILGLSRYIS